MLSSGNQTWEFSKKIIFPIPTLQITFNIPVSSHVWLELMYDLNSLPSILGANLFKCGIAVVSKATD